MKTASKITEKEKKLLDDIEKRAKDLQDRLGLLDKPVMILPAWFHRHAKQINDLFATAEQLKSWLASGYFDEIKYEEAIRWMAEFLKGLNNQLDSSRRLFWGSVRNAKKAADMLTKIERAEIALSGMEKGEVRENILGELERVRIAERKFNEIVDSLRLYAFKLREVVHDIKYEIGIYEDYLKTKRLASLKKHTRMGKIEKEIDYIRTVIVPAGSTVHINLGSITNTLYTLRSHVPALKKGARWPVTLRSA